mgnify:CR=1 FL=1
MKIAKKPIMCNTTPVVESDVTEELNTMLYDDVISAVKTAIDRLGAIARRTGDVKAKEAIANLSVVLFELQD